MKLDNDYSAHIATKQIDFYIKFENIIVMPKHQLLFYKSEIFNL